MLAEEDSDMDTGTVSVSLPAETVKMVRAQIESGAYTTESEVMAGALLFWQTRFDDRPHRLELIRAKLDEAAAHPERVTDDRVGQRLDHLFDEYTLKQAR